MGTAEDISRQGGARAKGVGRRAASRRTVDHARKTLARLSDMLDQEIERFEAAIEPDTEPARIKALQELIRQHQKALLYVIAGNARLAEGARGRPRKGRDVIDLGEARAEIARRLARLAE